MNRSPPVKPAALASGRGWIVLQGAHCFPLSPFGCWYLNLRLTATRIEPAAIVEGLPVDKDHLADFGRRRQSHGEPILGRRFAVESDYEAFRISICNGTLHVAGAGTAFRSSISRLLPPCPTGIHTL